MMSVGKRTGALHAWFDVTAEQGECEIRKEKEMRPLRKKNNQHQSQHSTDDDVDDQSDDVSNAWHLVSLFSIE